MSNIHLFLAVLFAFVSVATTYSQEEIVDIMRRNFQDTEAARAANAISDFEMKNYPIKKFTISNLKYFLASYNVCSDAVADAARHRRLRRSSGGSGSAAASASGSGGGGDAICECAKDMFSEGEKPEFVECCSTITQWLQDILDDEELLKKIWKVEQGEEDDAFKSYSDEVNKCFDGQLSGDFDVRADSLDSEFLLPTKTVTLTMPLILTGVLLLADKNK